MRGAGGSLRRLGRILVLRSGCGSLRGRGRRCDALALRRRGQSRNGCRLRGGGQAGGLSVLVGWELAF